MRPKKNQKSKRMKYGEWSNRKFKRSQPRHNAYYDEENEPLPEKNEMRVR